jgi:hypothetical protein
MKIHWNDEIAMGAQKTLTQYGKGFPKTFAYIFFISDDFLQNLQPKGNIPYLQWIQI